MISSKNMEIAELKKLIIDALKRKHDVHTLRVETAGDIVRFKN